MIAPPHPGDGDALDDDADDRLGGGAPGLQGIEAEQHEEHPPVVAVEADLRRIGGIHTFTLLPVRFRETSPPVRWQASDLCIQGRFALHEAIVRILPDAYPLVDAPRGPDYSTSNDPRLCA